MLGSGPDSCDTPIAPVGGRKPCEISVQVGRLALRRGHHRPGYVPRSELPHAGFLEPAARDLRLVREPPHLPVLGADPEPSGPFLDSTKVRSLQWPIRTYRAERVSIVPERDRIYMKFGSTFVSYRLSTFFVRDLNGPMTAVSGRDPAGAVPSLHRLGLSRKNRDGRSCSRTVRSGSLSDTTGTDRGYVYLPYTIFGWGIVQDREGSFTFVKQMGGPLAGAGSDVTPKGTISFKSEGKYYVYVYDTHATRGALFDVTNPSRSHVRQAPDPRDLQFREGDDRRKPGDRLHRSQHGRDQAVQRRGIHRGRRPRKSHRPVGRDPLHGDRLGRDAVLQALEGGLSSPASWP